MIYPAPHPKHTVNVDQDSLLTLFDSIGKSGARKKFTQNELIDPKTLENLLHRMDKCEGLTHKGRIIY